LLTKWLNQLVNTKTDYSTEQRILNAARKVFFRKGFAGARMQDIADEAGINKALLHYYFRNKETLFAMILSEALSKLIPTVSGIFGAEGSFDAKIRAFVDAYITMAMENPFLPLFVLNSLHAGLDNEVTSSFRDMVGQMPFQRVREAIAQAIRKGEIRPIDPQQLIMNTISLCLFPFVARPVFEMVTHVEPAMYDAMLERRKKEVADFILISISPNTGSTFTDKSTDHA
jgi:AcrR family transcriptional regulator